jgi:hypothetical protein
VSGAADADSSSLVARFQLIRTEDSEFSWIESRLFARRRPEAAHPVRYPFIRAGAAGVAPPDFAAGRQRLEFVPAGVLSFEKTAAGSLSPARVSAQHRHSCDPWVERRKALVQDERLSRPTAASFAV